MDDLMIDVSVRYRNEIVVLKVPETLLESIKMHAENRKVPRNQVYVEALDKVGAYTKEIAECERVIQTQFPSTTIRRGVGSKLMKGGPMEEPPIQFGADCCINCEKKFLSQDEDRQLQLSDGSRDEEDKAQ